MRIIDNWWTYEEINVNKFFSWPVEPWTLFCMYEIDGYEIITNGECIFLTDDNQLVDQNFIKLNEKL